MNTPLNYKEITCSKITIRNDYFTPILKETACRKQTYTSYKNSNEKKYRSK